uniref:MFS transporter n=1 Tax=Cyberlindnera americana TaxID=36016 RepID=A0A5P8N8Q3_9ASCO|nr:MFS transporter [Cyberlindnera americana]
MVNGHLLDKMASIGSESIIEDSKKTVVPSTEECNTTDLEKTTEESPKTNRVLIKEKDTTQSSPIHPAYSAFSTRRKASIIFIVTFAGFLGPVSGNIYIPILPQLKEVFNCSTTTINATVSVFMVFFAIAPLLWASWADFGGRKMLYLSSLIFYILANILLATVPTNIGALFVLRILQAFGASSVMSVGAGTVSDVIPPKDRAKAISYFMLGPQLGPVLGPIFSIIAWKGEWRWIFGFLAFLGGAVYLIILFFLPETLRCLVGTGENLELNGLFLKPHLKQKCILTEEEQLRFPAPPKPSLKGYWNLLKYKPVALCSFNAGLLFAGFYGMSVTFAERLKEQYHFSTLAVCFSYICPGVSLVSGSITGGRISDSLRKRMLKVHPGRYVPEHRFSLQFVGLTITIAGMLGYGWCIDKNVHVAAVFVFSFLVGFGMTFVFVTTTTYLTECSTGQPATNVAIGNFFRNTCAAVASVIVHPLITKMGFGWCFSGLAFVDLAGMGIVALLIYKGPRWRAEFEAKKAKH